MQSMINRWKMRYLTLEGKILTVKTLVLSKIVFPISLLNEPQFVRPRIKEMVYNFIWKGKDKVKRNVLINSKCQGGLNMIDIDGFVESIKAAWITRLLRCKGKWKSIFENYISKCGLKLTYLLNMSIKSVKSFPILESLPPFY